MTKEELIAKMDIECPDSEISYDYPAPLLYRIYRMYKEMQENYGIILVNECEDEKSNVALTMTLTIEKLLGHPLAFVTVFKDGRALN